MKDHPENGERAEQATYEDEQATSKRTVTIPLKEYDEIKRFIMFYQRITLQMIKDLSKSASIVMLLKKNHEIKKVLFKS